MSDFLLNIKKGLIDWIEQELNMTVILAEQYKIRPEKTPYAVVRVATIATYAFQDDPSEIDDNGFVNYQGHRKASVYLEIVGNTANEKIMMLQATLSKGTTLDKLWNDYGIAVLDKGSPVNITSLLETDGIERASLDIQIGFAIEVQDEVNFIENVEINDVIVPVIVQN